MKISTKVDLSGLKALTQNRLLNNLTTAKIDALNRTAFSARKSIQSALPGWIDMPSKKAFITRQVQVSKANKGKQYSEVGFTTKLPVVELMTDVRTHTVRIPHGQHIAIPTSNVGRVTRSKTPKALLARSGTGSRKRYFEARIKNTLGIWEAQRIPGSRRRRGGLKDNIRLMYLLVPRTVYKTPDIPLGKTVRKIVDRRFDKYFLESFDKAVRKSAQRN
jgi:hypothetical protein